jgi:hypothetical protein
VTDFRGTEPNRPEELLIEVVDERSLREARERRAALLQLLWRSRRFLFCATVGGLIIAFTIALLIPNRYAASAKLMPPDQTAPGGAAILAGLSSSGNGGLASLAESALGERTSGALFIGILNSDTQIMHRIGPHRGLSSDCAPGRFRWLAS